MSTPTTYRCPICGQRVTLHLPPSCPPTCSRQHRPKEMTMDDHDD